MSLVCLLAWDAFVAMEKSAAEFTEGKPLMEGSMATNLLSLAAQFALEVQIGSLRLVGSL